MSVIPLKMRREMAEDPFYHTCCITDGNCWGRIEWHHAITFAGKKIQRKFAILPACEYHHEKVAIFKKIFHWIALNRATPEELEEFKKANFKRELIILNKLYERFTKNNNRRTQ